MLYAIREIKNIGTFWLDKRCQYCGQHFQRGDNLALLIVDPSIKKEYKKLSKNYIMHMDEYAELYTKHGGNQTTIVKELGTKPTPRENRGLSELDNKRLELVKFHSRRAGFSTEAKLPNQVYKFHRKHGSEYVLYNALTHQLEVKEGKRGAPYSKLLLNLEIARNIGIAVDAEMGITESRT